MGEALKEAFSDIFVLREKPGDPDRALVEGKFKSAHNVADRPAKLMASTFYALLGLADIDHRKPEAPPVPEPNKTIKESEETKEEPLAEGLRRAKPRQVCTTIFKYIYQQPKISKFLTQSSSP